MGYLDIANERDIDTPKLHIETEERNSDTEPAVLALCVIPIQDVWRRTLGVGFPHIRRWVGYFIRYFANIYLIGVNVAFSPTCPIAKASGR